MLPLLLSALASASEPEPYHNLDQQESLAPGALVWTAGSLVNVRAGPAADAPVLRRLPAGTRAKVLRQEGDRVEVRVGAARGWTRRDLLTTMGMRADLDEDGQEERIVVAYDEEDRPTAWLREGERVERVALYAWPDPYLATWEIVPEAEAGLPLLRIHLTQDSCGAYPTAWLSYQGDRLQQALAVEEWVDGAMAVHAEVRFEAPGRAVVIESERGEDGEIAATRARACALEGGVFVCR